jgi:hypothetical protein
VLIDTIDGIASGLDGRLNGRCPPYHYVSSIPRASIIYPGGSNDILSSAELRGLATRVVGKMHDEYLSKDKT